MISWLPRVNLDPETVDYVETLKPVFGFLHCPKTSAGIVRKQLYSHNLLSEPPNTCPSEDEGFLEIYLNDTAARYVAAEQWNSFPEPLAELLRSKEVIGHIGKRYPSAPPEEHSAKRVKSTFTFTELFSGIGGFRLGLEALGGQCLQACERSRPARATYRANFGDEPLTDVRLLTSLPPHTLLTAGFPCQSFSKAGTQNGLEEVEKGALFFEITRLLTLSQPPAFCLENVPFLAELDNGKTLQIIVHELQNCGYDVAHTIYDASVCLPQTRSRLFIIGLRRDLAATPRLTDWPALPVMSPRPVFADIVESLSPEATSSLQLTPHQEAALVGPNRLVSPDQPCRTIMASYKKAFKFHSQFVSVPGQPPRFFSPRECARAQGFPESFILDSLSVSERNRIYAQLGNAVPPPLVATVCCALLNALDIPTKDVTLELVTSVLVNR